jgi:hypothetical protein
MLIKMFLRKYFLTSSFCTVQCSGTVRFSTLVDSALTRKYKANNKNLPWTNTLAYFFRTTKNINNFVTRIANEGDRLHLFEMSPGHQNYSFIFIQNKLACLSLVTLSSYFPIHGKAGRLILELVFVDQTLCRSNVCRPTDR